MQSKKSKNGNKISLRGQFHNEKEIFDMDTNLINLHCSKTLIKYTKSKLLKNVEQNRNKIVSNSISEISSFAHINSQMHQGKHDIPKVQWTVFFCCYYLFWHFSFPSPLFPDIFHLILRQIVLTLHVFTDSFLCADNKLLL